MVRFLFNLHKKFCPKLFLAPMEGVGSFALRRSIANIGGFDEACAPFIRVPKNASIKGLAKKFDLTETFPIPQAAQIMGTDPILMRDLVSDLVAKGVHRIDINFGCPSNVVIRRGAGSALLENTEKLYEITKKIVDGVSVPVSVKMRAGFNDTSLFEDNLLAIQDAGASFVILHSRTRKEGFLPPPHWKRIARAKKLLKIPVVGNGDVFSVDDAKRMIEQTNCDGIMIGRGALINPFLFHEIKSHYEGKKFQYTWEAMNLFLNIFFTHISVKSKKVQINELKQLSSYIFLKNDKLKKCKKEILNNDIKDPKILFEKIIAFLKKFY